MWGSSAVGAAAPSESAACLMGTAFTMALVEVFDELAPCGGFESWPVCTDSVGIGNGKVSECRGGCSTDFGSNVCNTPMCGCEL